MTNFLYEHLPQVEEFAEKYCGEKEKEIIQLSETNISFYKYLLAYRVQCAKRISTKLCRQIKEYAMWHSDRNTMIFLEKLKQSKKDYLYFEEEMKLIEKCEDFHYAFFFEAAA